MADYSRTVGDTSPFFWSRLEDGAGNAANLIDASLRFIMRGVRASSPKVAAAAVIENPTTNAVYYAPTADDVDEEGGYFIDWEVTYSSGKVETFPNDRSMTCDILPDLEAVEGS